MENITIENAKTRFFESKEHYLKFRQAWKDFHNSDKLVWREDVQVYAWSLRKDVTMRNVKMTALSAEHYLLYNLLRGYDLSYGFVPLQNTEEHIKWQARDAAVYAIKRAARDLQSVNHASTIPRERYRKNVERMLLPFGGTISHQVLYDIGEWLNINVHNNQNWPQFEIEEWKTEEDFERDAFCNDLKNPKRKTLKEKLFAWKTA